QRGNFGFELDDALGQIAERRADGLGKRKAEFVGAAPLHMREDRLFLLRDVKLDLIGHAHRVREDDARPLIRDVANEAVERIAALVENKTAAQIALLPG